MAKLNPIHDLVLIDPAPPPRRSAVLEVVEYARPVETAGTVIGIGPEVRAVPLGAKVVFAASSGQEVAWGRDRTFILLREAEVLAVLVPDVDVTDSPPDVEGAAV